MRIWTGLSVAASFLLIAFVMSKIAVNLGGCSFDVSGSSAFSGCFQGSDATEETTLELDADRADRDAIKGWLCIVVLATGEGQVFNLAGRAESDTFAKLDSTPLPSGEVVEIEVVKAPDGTLIVQLPDSPPSVPLSRLPDPPMCPCPLQ